MSFGIYVMGVADSLIVFGKIISVIGCLSLLMSIIVLVGSDYSSEQVSRILRVGKFSLVALIIGVLCSVFIPSSKTIAAMYIVPTVVENDNIQEITGNGLEILKLKTREWIVEQTETTE